jgi:hypothetical protein
MARYLRLDPTPEEAARDLRHWLRHVAAYLDTLDEAGITQDERKIRTENAKTFAADAREYVVALESTDPHAESSVFAGMETA